MDSCQLRLPAGNDLIFISKTLGDQSHGAIDAARNQSSIGEEHYVYAAQPLGSMPSFARNYCVTAVNFEPSA
jgi:hypothetical protein